MRKFVVLFLLSLPFLTVRANNVQLQGFVQAVSVTGGVATLEVQLSWDNSWRDDYNWDAVWLFLKYKVGVDGAWQHMMLNNPGALVKGDNYATMVATTGATVPGVFVYPAKNRGGNTEAITVQVQWKTTYTQADFDSHKVFLVAHGVEMVYVPYGAYFIGDDASVRSFPKQVIDSETAWNGTNAVHPKGYQGFYVMKYETSQEQYIEFLNSLTLAQQKALIPGVETLQAGQFVFGANRTTPNKRNGVVLAAKPENKPLIFDCNLNGNTLYGESTDGATLAMNYMSVSDAQGYAAWAGLRPMTEMEYEKACRRPYPQEPDKGEYAWNSADKPMYAGGLNNAGSVMESVTTGNVNANNVLDGPVRCGTFAHVGSVNQMRTGATYWGVMEMSGNLSEICATITNTIISKTGNGAGVFNTTLFGSTSALFGTRGGSFSDTDTTLMTSDRSAVSCFKTTLQRDSTIGFRCACSLSTEMDAGTVSCRNGLAGDTTCIGSFMTFKGTSPTKGFGKVSYTWYKSEDSGKTWTIAGVTGNETWTYSQFANETTTFRLYKFKRKAVCLTGDAFSSELSVYVAPLPQSQIFTNPPTSVQISTPWGNMFTGNWTLQSAPVELQISSTGMLSGVPPDMIATFKATFRPDKCPDITSYNNEIIIRHDFAYTAKEQIVQLTPGTYVMECWGAQGGYACQDNRKTADGGKGGYTYGEIVLATSQTFYIYTGGMGGAGNGPGWNGGGTGGANRDGEPGGSGGGASDIRLLSSNLYSRIMIAGGGGGAFNRMVNSNHGGGINSSIAYNNGITTQTSGYAFGRGGNGGPDGNSQSGGGAGGGGYYGGLGRPANGGHGVGGSGFVSGMPGCDAIKADGDLTPTGQSRHYSGVVFLNPKMENGLRAGHGLVRIQAK